MGISLWGQHEEMMQAVVLVNNIFHMIIRGAASLALLLWLQHLPMGVVVSWSAAECSPPPSGFTWKLFLSSSPVPPLSKAVFPNYGGKVWPWFWSSCNSFLPPPPTSSSSFFSGLCELAFQIFSILSWFMILYVKCRVFKENDQVTAEETNL